MAGVTDVWPEDPFRAQLKPEDLGARYRLWKAFHEMTGLPRPPEDRDAGAEVLGDAPGSPMSAITHAGRNLIPFARAFRTALEVLADAKGVTARELPKLDIAKVYMGLRYPRFSRMFGVGEARGEQMPGYRGKSLMFDVQPGNVLQEARDPRAAINVEGTVSDMIDTLTHEGLHGRQRVRSLRGLTKDIRPEDLIDEGFADPVTGRPGRYVHFEVDPDRYYAQPVEKYATQGGTTAEIGAKNLVDRLLKQRELMREAGRDIGKAATTSAGEQLLRLMGYF